jgi:hypothetical protein
MKRSLPRRYWSTLLVGAMFSCIPYARVEARQTDSISFQKPIHLRTGSQPQSVLILDVNHDGKNDIVIGNVGSSNISVYLGDGKGGFTAVPGSPFSAGPVPNDLAVGDFNGDGNPDLAVANHSVKLVTVLLGNGHGGFSLAPGSPFSVPSDPHPHGIAAADFNGDGKPDLVVDSWGEDKVLVMMGNGDGTFRTPGSKFRVGQAPYERLRTADLNEDGHPDIVTSNWKGASVSVLLGDGKGGFSLAGGKHVPVPSSPFGVAIADFNGDHHLDIAVAHYSGQAVDPSKNGLSVLYGNGDGTFRLGSGSPYPVGHYPPTVVAGDLNGDGMADIVIPNHLDNTVTIYLGGNDGIRQATGSPFAVGHGPQSAAIGDLNGDGKADLVVSDELDNEVIVLFRK